MTLVWKGLIKCIYAKQFVLVVVCNENVEKVGRSIYKRYIKSVCVCIANVHHLHGIYSCTEILEWDFTFHHFLLASTKCWKCWIECDCVCAYHRECLLDTENKLALSTYIKAWNFHNSFDHVFRWMAARIWCAKHSDFYYVIDFSRNSLALPKLKWQNTFDTLF